MNRQVDSRRTTNILGPWLENNHLNTRKSSRKFCRSVYPRIAIRQRLFDAARHSQVIMDFAVNLALISGEVRRY
ncbi:hypothetical protein J6590_041042 [Homalodisca vitripennis]|nr:hypothetical protein J6590_041042 [Homalodisca vitripennis]